MTQEKEIVYIVFYALIFLILLLTAIVIFVVMSRKKIIKKEIENKNLEIKFQKDILQATIITQEKERERIAQDLHDDISSRLNIVSLNAQLLKSENLSKTESDEIIGNIVGFTLNAIENTRKIAHDLLPPVLEKFGIHTAIEELIMEFESAKKVSFVYKNEIDFSKTSKNVQLHLFRILQELITNSLKHGKASNIRISFFVDKETFFCDYVDNGVGFDTLGAKYKKGLGLNNINSRIDFLKGNYSLVSEPNEGVNFKFSFLL